MSDIFGATIEHYIIPSKPIGQTWILGEDLFFNGVGVRSMADPAHFSVRASLVLSAIAFPRLVCGSNTSIGYFWLAEQRLLSPEIRWYVRNAMSVAPLMAKHSNGSFRSLSPTGTFDNGGVH